jgi:hypothetical protein
MSSSFDKHIHSITKVSKYDVKKKKKKKEKKKVKISGAHCGGARKLLL